MRITPIGICGYTCYNIVRYYSVQQKRRNKMENYFKPETICIQGGYEPRKGDPRILPIYQSTTFRYENSDEMGKLFDLEAEGYFYSRLQNPTCDMVAKKICQLEGGTAALLTASGQAANF